MSTEARCTISTLRPERMLTNNALDVWSTHHTIHGLIEVDVSTARRLLRERRLASGETLSMTAFVIHCLAVAVSREPRLNSLVKGARLYTFDTVNIATMVERESAGEKVIAGVVIRGAEAKTVGEIHDEIRRAQSQPVESVGDMRRMRWLGRLPGWLFRLAMRVMFRRPSLVHQMGGVTGVTAVGMFASGIAWGLPITPNTVMLTIGGIGKRPAMEAGQLVEREVLCLTVSFDHAVVDGAPAARFTSMLRALLSAADGLDSPAEATSR